MQKFSPHTAGLCALSLLALALTGCSYRHNTTALASTTTTPHPALGFDRNDYPGDTQMAALHRTFGFTGYWLTSPPGAASNSWLGKREVLLRQGWGFLVLANGRLDKEILAAQKQGTTPVQLAAKDAAAAVAAAKREDFPAGTVLFVDQEEGGAMLDEQGAYLLTWTEAVHAAGFRAGIYASGQPVPDGPGKTITTIQDLRQLITARHLHPVAFFAAQDACPPAPGCTVRARPLADSGTLVLDPAGDLIAWQYAQSPRRPEITLSCTKTYAADGNCYAPGFPNTFLDMDTASTPDPSHGR